MNADERRFIVPGLRRGVGSLVAQEAGHSERRGLGFGGGVAQKVSMGTTVKNAKVAKLYDLIL